MSPETQLFGVFNHIPMGIVLSIIALLLIASFFITSADSATFVLGMQTTFGSLNPSSMVKVTWGVAQALIAFVLLLAGGGDGSKALNAIQSAAIISAFPFSFVVIMMMISFYKDANQERKFLGLTLTPNKHRLQDYVRYQQEDYESDILEKENLEEIKKRRIIVINFKAYKCELTFILIGFLLINLNGIDNHSQLIIFTYCTIS